MISYEQTFYFLFFEGRPLARNVVFIRKLMIKMLHNEILEVNAFHFNKISQLFLCVLLCPLHQTSNFTLSHLLVTSQLQFTI